MRNAVAVREGVPDVADSAKIQRLVDVLKRAGGGPLMVRQIAEAMPTSLTTAGKYVDICQAKGLVVVKPYASAKQVWLVGSSGNGGAGVGRV